MHVNTTSALIVNYKIAVNVHQITLTVSQNLLKNHIDLNEH